MVWSGAAVVAGVAMWLPPVVDQLIHEPGNMTILVDTYRAQTGHVIGLGSGGRVLLTQLDPVGNWVLGTRRIQSSVLPGLVLVLAWLTGAWSAWRRRDHDLVRLDVLIAVLVGCALFWAVRLDSTRYLYLVEWFWVLTGLMVLSTAWSALLWLAERSRAPIRTAPIASTLALTLLAVTTVGVWTSVGVEPPDMRYSATVQAVSGPTARALEPGRRYLVRWVDPVALGGNGFGVMLELERQGFDVGAPSVFSAAVEPHRVRSEDQTDAVVTVVTGDDNIAKARRIDGAEEVAFSDGRTAGQRLEYRRLEQRAGRELRAQGLDEVADQIHGTIWAGLIDPRVGPQAFSSLSRMLELGQATAVFISPVPLPGL